jgi:hypothetical protein
VLNADTSEWSQFLFVVTPAVRRQAIDVHHRKKRAEDEQELSIQDVERLVKFVSGQEKTIRDALNKTRKEILENAHSSTSLDRFKFGQCTLLQLKLMGLSRFVQSANVLHSITLPALQKILKKLPDCNLYEYWTELREDDFAYDDEEIQQEEEVREETEKNDDDDDDTDDDDEEV